MKLHNDVLPDRNLQTTDDTFERYLKKMYQQNSILFVYIK
jgi:hypothetical protein